MTGLYKNDQEKSTDLALAGGKIALHITTNQNGQARLQSVSREAPSNNSDELRAWAAARLAIDRAMRLPAGRSNDSDA